MKKYIAAVVQAAPVLFDLEETLKKTARLVEAAADKGSSLTLFPEAYIPCYPRGLSFGTVVGSRTESGRQLWRMYWENAIEVPGKACDDLGKMAKMAKCHLSIGVMEKDGGSKGSLYCTLLYFGPNGKLLGKHQKLKPTAAERIIWGEGDGSTLAAVDTQLGKLGGLICWENYMPLARMAMYEQGVEVYLAPTADQRDSWQATLRHIACEGRCYVLGANQYVTKKMYPAAVREMESLDSQPDVMCIGGSVIVDPLGNAVAGPLFGSEGILTAEIYLDKVVESKLDFDVCGHYARKDVFEFRVK